MLTGIAVFAVLAVSGCNSQDDCVMQNEGMQTMHKEGLTLLNDDGRALHFQSLIADDQLERSLGFQYVCPEAVRQAKIMFVYAQPVYSSFHMSNVHAALDIGFFDEQGLLLSVMQMEVYTDDRRPLYSANQPFKYALETSAGFFKESNLTPGLSRLLTSSL